MLCLICNYNNHTTSVLHVGNIILYEAPKYIHKYMNSSMLVHNAMVKKSNTTHFFIVMLHTGLGNKC